MSVVQLKKNIKLLREKKRWKQSELADIIGVSHSTPWYWESLSKKEIPLRHIISLSMIFGCTIDALCKHDFNKYPINQREDMN